MLRSVLTLSAAMGAATLAMGQASVQVEPYHLEGPRPLQQQTADAVVRDYLDSWQSLNRALGQNSVAALDRDFVGDAMDKLSQTVQQQSRMGVRSEYSDQSHDIQIVYYSPEGLSVELTDKVEYDVRIFDRDKLQTTQHVSARYVVVLTPTEVRWRVRVFQAVPE
jgi:hypothetical protein